VEEFMQAQEAATQLKTSLENLGMSDSFDRFKEKGDRIQKAFKWIDNDDVNKALGQLITYGKLTEAQIDQLLPVIVDFAAKTGKTVPEATDALIKGLEGSGKELKTFGVQVNASNSATENLNILLTQLAPRVRDAAQAFGNDLKGAIAITRQEINDIKEDIGERLAPAVKAFYMGLSGMIQGIQNLLKYGGYAITFSTKGLVAGMTEMAADKAVDAVLARKAEMHDKLVALTMDFEKKDAQETS
jgi:uncharacterized protein YukE